MMHGHEAETELWVYVPLEPDEAPLMIDDPPRLLVEWLAGRAGREAFLAIAQDGVLLVSTLWTIPASDPRDLPASAALAIRTELNRALREDLPNETRRALDGGRRRFRDLVDAA